MIFIIYESHFGSTPRNWNYALSLCREEVFQRVAKFTANHWRPRNNPAKSADTGKAMVIEWHDVEFAVFLERRHNFLRHHQVDLEAKLSRLATQKGRDSEAVRLMAQFLNREPA